MSRLFASLSLAEVGRAALAGFVASAAYLLAMWLDLRLVRYPFNDLTLLGRPFSAERRRRLRIGFALHMFNGSIIGIGFAIVRRFLPGPGWVKGLLFGQMEDAALWPMMLLVDRYHPGRRDGELPPGWSRRSYRVAVARRLAYRLVLGVLYRPDTARRGSAGGAG